MIAVQRIVTSWTKRSRGGPGATHRNAVAEAFALPAARGVAAVVHEVAARETTGFVPTETTRALDRLPVVDPVRLAEYGWGEARLAADPWVAWQMAVDRVDHRVRDTLALRAAVAPVAPGVFLMAADDLLQVAISPPLAPVEGDIPWRVVTVSAGHWVRWRFNARFTPGGCGCRAHRWWYEKWVVNVAFHATWSPDLFTATEPDRVIGNFGRLS